MPFESPCRKSRSICNMLLLFTQCLIRYLWLCRCRRFACTRSPSQSWSSVNHHSQSDLLGLLGEGLAKRP
jgi:hypothetical protein